MKKFILVILFLSVSLNLFSQEQTAVITEITASSSLASYLTYHYGPEMAFDGQSMTAWVEGAEGHGIGEYIELVLDREITIDAIGIMPGYFDPPYFYSNNRVKTLRMDTLIAGIELHFSDRMEEDIISFTGNLTFKKIRFKISDIYPGNDPDTCIAEITFYWEGKKIPLVYGPQLERREQRLGETKYYRTGAYDDETEGALRKKYMVMSYNTPEIIIYREAFNLSLLTEISLLEYEGELNDYCEEECLFIKVVPGPGGYIKNITTSYDHRASTGVVSNTFIFDSDGLLMEMSVDSQTASYSPIKVYHSETKRGREFRIVKNFEYWQGNTGEAVTVNTYIYFNDEYEIVDSSSEFESQYLYTDPQ